MRLSALVKGQLLAFPKRIIYNTWHCVVGLQVLPGTAYLKQQLALRRGSCSTGKNPPRQWLLRNRRLFRDKSFFGRHGGLGGTPTAGLAGGVAHARAPQ